MGIWAVTGNHEFHGGGNMSLFEKAGFKMLDSRPTRAFSHVGEQGIDVQTWGLLL